MLTITTSEKTKKFQIGEIFEYGGQQFEESTGLYEPWTARAFFIKSNDDYYVLTFSDEGGSFEFFEQVSGLTYKGKDRKGKDPFTYLEVLEYLNLKNPVPTGQFVWKNEETSKIGFKKKVSENVW